MLEAKECKTDEKHCLNEEGNADAKDAVVRSRIRRDASKLQTGTTFGPKEKVELANRVETLEKGHLRIQTIVDQLSEEKAKANNNRDQSEEHIPFITEQPLNDDHNTNPNEDIESNNDKFDRDSSLSRVEELDQTANLDPNTFSFLISSRFLSVPFLTGIFVFLVKNSIFVLTFLNIIDFRNSFNKLGVPVTVVLSVSIAQFLAFCISVLTQDDLLTAIILLIQGYDADIRRVFGDDGGGGTFWQWCLTLSISFFDGLFGLVVTFLLIVKTPTVLDLILNFAAVEFVTGLDEAAFYLAKLGLLGQLNRLEVARVEDGTFSVRRQHKNAYRRLRTLGLFIILGFITAAWAYFTALQAQGRYATKTFIVQFDDNVRRELSAHSGWYTLDTTYNSNPHRRFKYVEERKGGRRGQFEYCPEKRRWTYFLEGTNPCDQSTILVTSIITGELDLTLLTAEDWFVVLPGKVQALPMADFYISPGCVIDDDCGGASKGECVRNKCQCKDGFYGFRCVHAESETCPELVIDANFGKVFPSVRQLPTSFTRLEGARFYQRPVYYSTTNATNTTDLILFTGTRWAVTGLEKGFNINTSDMNDFKKNVVSESSSAQMNSGSFNAENIGTLDVLSAAVLYRSPDDRFNNPSNLLWDTVTNQAPLADALVTTPIVPTILICAKCDKSNSCFHGNACGVDGKCICTNGATGPLCQVTPEGNGFCNTYFNTHEFNYDGGDCCEKTCVSSSEHVCGGRVVGRIPSVTVGFPFCKDPSIVGGCDGANDPCYIPNSDPIPGISSFLVVPALSGNGRILALADPILSTIRVYDNVEGRWIQRGSTLQSSSRNLLTGLAVATPSSTAASTLVGHVPAYVAASSAITGVVVLYEWDTAAVDWVLLEAPPLPWVSAEEDWFHRLELGVQWIDLPSKLVSLLFANETDFGPGTILARDLTSSDDWMVYNMIADNFALSPCGSMVMTVSERAFVNEPISSFIVNVFDPHTNSSIVSNAILSFPSGTIVVAMDIVGFTRWSDFLDIVLVTSDISGNATTANYLSLDIDLPGYFSRGVAVVDWSPGDSIVFSNGGETLVVASDGGNGVMTYSTVFFDTRTGVPRSFEPLPGNVLLLAGLSAAVSNGGSTLVEPAATTQVYSVKGKCDRSTEQALRVSISEDFLPSEWAVMYFAEYKGTPVRKVLAECACRPDKPHVIDHAVVVEEACIPNDIPNVCMNLYANISAIAPSFGLAAFLMNSNNATLFAHVEAPEGQFSFADFANPMSSETCEFQAHCGGGLAPFVLIHRFNEAYVGEAFFDFLLDGTTTSILGGSHAPGNHFPISSNVSDFCFPKEGCHELNMWGTSRSIEFAGEYILDFDGNETRGSWNASETTTVKFGRCT